jgi:urea transport system permease protein
VAVGKVLILVALLALAGARGGLEAAPTASGPSSVELDALAAQLAQPDRQKDAILALERLGDPAAEPLLRGLKDGALYLWLGRVALLADDGSVTDARGRPLVDAQGTPAALESGQEAIAVEETLFGTIQRVLEGFAVFGPDPGARKSAAFRLGNSTDPPAAVVLGRALEREKDPDVRAALEEAVAKQGLASPNPGVRVEAVRQLAQARSEAALGQLRSRAAQDGDASVRAAAQDAVREIDSYLGLRNLVGWLFNGISLGAVLLIMSLGLAVTFGLMGIINMAHGEMLMVGSYTAYVVQELFATHFPGRADYYFFVALPLSFLTAGAVGLLLEGTVIRFLYGRPLETLIVTWGVGMIFHQAARLWFGDQTSVNSPTWFRGGIEPMPGLVFPWSRIFIVILSLAALVALWFALSRTYAGLKVRAVMQNRPMASCLGVSTRRIDAVTFALGTALAGVAGCALSLIGTVDPEVGKTYIVDSFMVVVLGGVGKLVGTVVAAFGLGLFNKLLEPVIGGTAAAVYAKVAVLLVVIWFLQWRPTGLFPQRGRAAAETA